MVTKGFCFGSTNGSQQAACRPVHPPDAGKHRLFCNPERRGVAFIAGLSAAEDEFRLFRSSRRATSVTCAQSFRTGSLMRPDRADRHFSIGGLQQQPVPVGRFSRMSFLR